MKETLKISLANQPHIESLLLQPLTPRHGSRQFRWPISADGKVQSRISIAEKRRIAIPGTIVSLPNQSITPDGVQRGHLLRLCYNLYHHHFYS